MDGRRVLAAMLLSASAVSAGAGELSLDSFEQRMQPCAACHGAQGRATRDGYYPRLAGKPAGYLFEQLLNFRDGQRQHAQMSYLVDRQPEAYLRRMAEHFAAAELPYPAPATAQAAASVLALGESLVRQGDAARGIPACESCHGAALTGIEPAVPGLLGLPYDYLAAQIGSWREGARQARAPDCMAEIARSLTPADVEAVATWLAAQPVPTPAKAAAGPVRTEVKCGSLESRP